MQIQFPLRLAEGQWKRWNAKLLKLMPTPDIQKCCIVLFFVMLFGTAFIDTAFAEAEIIQDMQLSQLSPTLSVEPGSDLGTGDREKRFMNPHWKTDRCTACHTSRPIGNQLNLKDKDIDKLCNTCHSGKIDHSYIHPSGVKVTDPDMRSRMPDAFRKKLVKGRLSCMTCHDIVAQCLPERRREVQWNPRFFRSGPYKDRTGICYKCHDQSKYRRLNAHDQIAADGQIKKYTCVLCHSNSKNLEKAKSIDDVEFHVKGSLVWICASCHPLIPHPGQGFSFTKSAREPNHLVVPPASIRKTMKESEVKRSVILPLDPNTGRIFCATCHNPHAKGVIGNPAAAKGADEKKRLRTEDICTNCHDK